MPWPLMTAEHIFARRIECQESGLYFNRFFFKQRYGGKMIVAPHHKIIQKTLDRVMLPHDHPDFISRLIINIPPRYTKTEMATIGLMARGLALNPRSRYVHLSTGDTLALKNSNDVRATIKNSHFQKMWPTEIRQDVDSKKLWYTERGGGMFASTVMGQVVGFGAGLMEEGFTGLLNIDDPIKPQDIYSAAIRDGVNNAYSETISSRIAHQNIPVVLVMQRLHWDDLSGYLLRGGSGEKWHHLNLPVIIDNSKEYPADYTHGIPIDHGLNDGWLWPFKHSAKHEVALRSHRRKFAAQYMQDPIKRDAETALWSEAVIAKARSLDFGDQPTRTIVAVDPATTNNSGSDEHGIMICSKYGENQYSLDADYSRKGSPLTWAEAAIAAAANHEADAIIIETNQGGDMCETTLRNAGFKGRIIRVHAAKGKTLRAEPVVALYEQGFVSHKGGLGAAEEEMMDFDPVTQKSNGRSPNRVDAGVYAITELAGLTQSFGVI